MELTNLKKQAHRMIDSLNTEEIKAMLEITKNIKDGSGIKIHVSNYDYCYTNISNDFLQVTTNHSKIGPKDEYVIPSTPYKKLISKILNKHVVTNGEKFTGELSGYVLKGINEVLFRSGDRVVFQNYMFYIDSNGAICKIYTTKNDYLNKKNTFCIATRLLQKIVPIEKLDEEYKLYKEMTDYWARNYNGYYSDDSDYSNESDDSNNGY